MTQAELAGKVKGLREAILQDLKAAVTTRLGAVGTDCGRWR